MSGRCKTCKITISPFDDWCAHCWPAAIDRQNKRLAKLARQTLDPVTKKVLSYRPVNKGLAAKKTKRKR